MALEAEQEVFHQHRRHLLEHHEGKFALVARGELVGVFGTFDDAYAHGVTRFGHSLFLVKQITRRMVRRLNSRYGWLDSQIDPDQSGIESESQPASRVRAIIHGRDAD